MSRTHTLLRLATLVVAATAAAGASGQGYFTPGYGTYGAPMSSFLASNVLAQQVASGAAAHGRHPDRSPSTRGTGITFVPGAPIAPAKMAAAYQPAARAQARQMFEQTLTVYHALEKKAGLHPNDLAGALATFIACNYYAWHDQTVPDDAFHALVRQMHGVLGGIAPLRHATNAEKQQLYEELAIVGTFVTLKREGLRQHPDAKLAMATRQAAHDYLVQFFKFEPERMHIDARGLAVR